MKTTKTKRNGNGRGSLFRRAGSETWVARFHDSNGRRVERSTGTASKRDAERILSKWVDELALVASGVVDADALRQRDERRRDLAEHVREYFEHYSTTPRTKKALEGKLYVLRRLLRHLRGQLGREPRLEDLSPREILRAMRAEVERGLSRRSANFLRQNAVALASWLTSEGRANLSDLGDRVPRFDESRDRRLVRRALAVDDLARLLEAAPKRRLWYSLAYFAGLRRGELGRVTWGDVDLAGGTLRIRNSKAGRLDEIPLHPALAAELASARPLLAPAALASAKVFANPVHVRTVRRDYDAAGIPRLDDEGRVADLHAMRTTLGTTLARAGVPVQTAAKAMRHADPRTTQRHYVALGLVDVAHALSCVPTPAALVAVATGTEGASDSVSVTPASSPASRGTQSRESARNLEKVSSESRRGEQTQPVIARDDTGRFATRHDDVLQSVFSRAYSSAD